MAKDYNRIRVALSEKKVANKALAEHLAVTETTVARWTNNKSQPDLSTLYRIAEFLGVAPCDLLERGNEIEAKG